MNRTIVATLPPVLELAGLLVLVSSIRPMSESVGSASGPSSYRSGGHSDSAQVILALLHNVQE